MKIPRNYQRSIELFVIEPAVIAACSMEEVLATYDDLVEMELARFPFPNFDLQFRGDVAAFALDKTMAEWTFEGRHSENEIWRYCFRDGACIDIRAVLPHGRTETVLPDGVSMDQLTEKLRSAMAETLERTGKAFEDYVTDGPSSVEKLFTVLLATKNIVKIKTEDKLWNLGIGRRNERRYRYTTTLRLPAERDLIHDAEHSTGITKRPHLRRGHIRRQRHGASLSQMRRIWIDPVFINADENFISARTAYVMRP